MYELTGTFQSMAFTAKGKPLVTFQIHEYTEAIKMAASLKDGVTATIKVGKHKKKRSIDANSYYWCLLGKLAGALKISNNYCHNLMLRRYGVLEQVGENAVFLVIPDTEEAGKQVDEAETYHLKPTAQVKEGKDGKPYRTYMLLKGSRSFDTAEMSRLISGIRDECKAVGIPVETPDEIAQLLSLMGDKR